LGKKILIVDDEPDVARVLKVRLTQHHHEVVVASTGSQGLRLAASAQPDLIILDLMLPDMDGIDVCKRLRVDSRTSRIPIIMLTAKSTDKDEIIGLEMGADDYMTKPFDFDVLQTRIKTIFRRVTDATPGTESKNVLKSGKLMLDGDRMKVFVANKQVVLTALQFRLLKYLMMHPGRAFDRNQIMDGAWPKDCTIVDRAVDVHINGIRDALGACADYIETVRGVGYRFRESES
jgi:DNA-binding response OmpR family regulator